MPQISNDRVILGGLLSNGATERPDLQPSEYFEFFCHRQILKRFSLSDDELADGLTDGSNDGGVDGWFAFVNGELIDGTFDPSQVRGQNPFIELEITQTKLADGFAEPPIMSLGGTLGDILQLDVDPKSLERRYNGDLLDKAAQFRRMYVALLALYPTLSVTITYATRGDTRTVSEGVKGRAQAVKGQVATLFRGSTIDVRFLGARELVDLSRVEPARPLQLRFIDTTATRDNAYVALIRLKDYASFIQDERGEIRTYLFESNVRAYQGSVLINKEIRQELSEGSDTDFWWLNNGVTILASRGNMSGKTLTISDVQIVNGLQSTTEIFEYSKRMPGNDHVKWPHLDHQNWPHPDRLVDRRSGDAQAAGGASFRFPWLVRRR